VSHVDLRGGFAADRVNEGLVDVGSRLGVEEANEAEAEKPSGRGVAPL
jgi:hypothetical protein